MTISKWRRGLCFYFKDDPRRENRYRCSHVELSCKGLQKVQVHKSVMPVSAYVLGDVLRSRGYLRVAPVRCVRSVVGLSPWQKQSHNMKVKITWSTSNHKAHQSKVAYITDPRHSSSQKRHASVKHMSWGMSFDRVGTYAWPLLDAFAVWSDWALGRSIIIIRRCALVINSQSA